MQKVSVPQQSGEISISRAGSEPVKYPVKDGVVQVEDADVDGFLRQIPDSSISGGKPAAGSPSKEA